MTNDELKAWVKEIGNIAPLLDGQIQISDTLVPGGQGMVYKGVYNGIPAAVKVYFPGQNETRVGREIDALSQIDCYSIVKLLWHGSIKVENIDIPVVATELVTGSPLSQVLNQRPLSEDELGTLAYDLAFAIKAMWKLRIVHRDLKPDNILLGNSQRACVIDLGVARHIDDTTLTAAGWTWGTKGYFSPEQARASKRLSCSSDVFALGIVLLECACRHHPTQRDQQRLLMNQYHSILPPEIAKWRFAPLVKRCLEPVQTNRPLPDKILSELAEYAPKL